MYHSNTGSAVVAFPTGYATVSGKIEQVSVMGNVLYDFFPGAMITPYIGGGVGVGFVDANIQGCKMCLAMFAYQGILGVGFNATPALRISLEGRYYGTTNPGAYFNNNIMALLSVSYKFGQPEVAPPPPPPPVVTPPSFMVFFDWDRSNLSQQALTTIQQAATPSRPRAARASRRPATPTRRARRATTWRCRCVAPTRSRTPWCATACRRRRSRSSARARASLLVPTGDNVREPQNRRVEIVIQ